MAFVNETSLSTTGCIYSGSLQSLSTMISSSQYFQCKVRIYLLKVHSDMKVPDGFENMKDMWASHVSGCTLLHMSGRYKHTINWKHVRAGSFSTDVPDSQRQPIGSSNPITRHQTRPVRADLMAHTENTAVMVHTCVCGEGIVRMSSNVTMTNPNLEKFQRNVEFWIELECELKNKNQNSS